MSSDFVTLCFLYPQIVYSFVARDGQELVYEFVGELSL